MLLPLAAILTGQGLKTRKVSDEFVGAWNLVSFQRKDKAGAITFPMGEKAVGRLTYDGLGRMSAQIMRPGRPTGDKVTAYDGYIAYYGTYEVKEKEGAVIHHVEACLYPNWVGSDQRRLYRFSEGKLILRAINGSGGPGTESILIWERSR